ncbi:hypothetical protein SB6095_05255 [Klebsiella quasivariicola]|nr:transcriptional regulator (LysR family) [Klebsiella quasivariicola]SLY42198.1 transcriptional regulator (LysR family) [Klebsiella quasivariicola]VAN61454.1 transcriptional regulator (LysR family) [Klebsiella quasivariicola]VGP08725.1 hypothetical protein SB00033_02130 [Klebsiella quasivariicola]VGQ15251.1 hypothetical protein SB6095_05255 [Klebsiella quasivariicola]
MRRCFVGWRFACPSWGSCDLPLIYSPFLLKLPVLAASTSLRRSRKAGAIPGKPMLICSQSQKNVLKLESGTKKAATERGLSG